MKEGFQKLVRTRAGRKLLIFVGSVLLFVYATTVGVDSVIRESSGESAFVKVSVQNIRGWFEGNLKNTFNAPRDSAAASPERARVKRVVDGDTIELETGEKVRYIGVNTPESVKTHSPIECFGKEASAKNKELVEGKVVRLEKDVSDRDKYGRLLRFVYLEDGTLVNNVLVQEGFARASTFPPDVSMAEVFTSSEREARTEGKGLWSSATCSGKR